MSKYYVYEYSHPITNEIFYVGKGTGDRMLKHLFETKDNTENYKKWAYIQGLRNKGLEPVVKKVFETDIENDAYNEEARRIKLYGRKGIDEIGTLMNICEDARPPKCRFRSLETRAKLSAAKKGKPNGHLGRKQSPEEIEKRKRTMKENHPDFAPMLGKKHSEETKAQMSSSSKASVTDEFRQRMREVNLGREHSEEHRRKNAAAKTGTTHSDETKKKMSESHKLIAEEQGKKVSAALKGKPWSEARRAAQLNRKGKDNE